MVNLFSSLKYVFAYMHATVVTMDTQELAPSSTQAKDYTGRDESGCIFASPREKQLNPEPKKRLVFMKLMYHIF